MKFSSLMVAFSYAANTNGSAVVALDIFECLQRDIHDDVVLINSILSQATAEPGVDTTVPKNDIADALQHIIASVKNATDVGASTPMGSLNTNLEGRDVISDVVFGIFDAIQAIVADLGIVILKALDFFNHSEVVINLSVLIVKALLGLINGLLRPLVGSQYSELLQQIINSIITLIPI
ncbi:hypothetical protein NLG97_g5521 [Lecanicillium saksenae]|uniref:Uncharacterized protein n=1 Tax=Lecanicillium saksenae TaxID=468837 RepID=A0ACC1QTJ8_9HYPO|nr:hypothetical protein NLG97_g5521 [Lecanicillium saksenae]